MRKLKNSGIDWIGEIPVDWTLQRGKTIFAQRLTKGNPSEILLAATQRYGMIPQSEVEGVVQIKEDTDIQQFRTVHKKDFVISLRSFQGGFEYSQYEGVCSPAYQVFYNTTPICHNYYRFLFKSEGFIQKMNSMTVGIREGKNIQYSDFANSLIPIPPIEQQCRIADYLDRKCSQIDSIIAKQQEVIEKLKEYKLSVITEAVTKGLNPDVPMKDSGIEWIGKISEHWETASIAHVATVVRGASPRPAGDPRYFSGQGIPWITVAEVTKDDGKYIESTKSYLSEEGAKYSRLVEKGTLLLSNSGATLGVPKVTLITGCINDGSVAFFDLKIKQMYLLYVFKSRTLELRKQMQGYGQPNLNTTIIKSIVIPLPNIDEQKYICEYLDKRCKGVDNAIKIKEEVVNRLAEYKKSLIYEVVTGKKEV